MATFQLTFFALLVLIIAQCSARYGRPIKANKEVTGIDPKDVVIQCYAAGVKVIIKKSRFPRIRSSHNLHFLDPLCIAGENGTHFIASTSFRRCGTTRKVQWNGLVHGNTLMTGFPETDDFDPRCPVVSIKFTCVQSFFLWPRPRMTRAVSKYIHCEHIIALGPKIKQGIFAFLKARSSGIRMRSRVKSCPMLIGIGPPIKSGEFARRTVISKAIAVKRTHAFVCRLLEGKAEHNLELTAYSDEGFSRRIGGVLKSTLPVVDVFYELKLTTVDSSLTIYPKRCYATPTSDPHHKIQYDLIKNGCIRDDSVQFYTSKAHAFRFSFKTFKFIGYPKRMVVTHCDVAICDVEDRESFCATRCAAKKIRRKRGGRQYSGFVKECKFDTIHVSLRRSMLRGAVPTDLQLNDPACAASVNETHFFFTIRHGKCATKSRSTGLRVEISNSINYRSRGSYIFSIPVKCSYTKMDRTAFAARALQIMHDERFVSVWLGAKYHFSQKTVLDSSVVDLIGSMPLNVITTETDGVLDTVITAKDENLDFVIDHCKIKPSPASIRKQTLVINDCTVNDHVLLYKTNVSTSLFIDFKHWHVPESRIFAKCHFTVCHRNSPSSKCSRKGCPQQPRVILNNIRKRRSNSINALNADVRCNPNKIVITIEKSTIPRLQAADLHLEEFSCRARENSTHIIFETKPYECRTSVKAFGTAVEYKNVIYSDEKFVDGIIDRTNSFKLPFKCVFVPSLRPNFSRRIRVKKPQIRFSAMSTGTYAVRLTLFTDPTYEREMNTFSARMSAGSEMYFQVAMESPNATMAIYLEICYGRPFFSSDNNEKYMFIRDNCPVDDSVLFYKSDRVDVKRFSVSPFEFNTAVHRSVFVDCIVSACDPRDKSSKCFKTCPDTPLPL